jgi:hypothetical protein
MVMGPDGAQNQERLCWRGSATIYWTEASQLTVSQRLEVGVSGQSVLGCIIRHHYQATSEDIEIEEDLVFAVVICRVC